jgi:tight adherence protein B
MPTFIIAIGLLVIAYLIYEIYNTSKTNKLLDRLNFGFKYEEQEEVSLWDGASDLLQLESLRNLLYSSALSRKLDLLIRRSFVNYTFLQVINTLFLVTIISAIVAYFFTNKLVISIAIVITFPLVTWFVFEYLAAKQQKRNDDQLASMITSMLTTMRAGGTPIQALQATVKNAGNPMRDSIANVMNNLQIGRTPNVVWKEWSDFWDTKNTKLIATGIRLKWESGGQMSSILEHILESIEFNKRVELRVSTLTAQSKMSAWVLASLPFALFALQYFYRADLINAMLATSTGTNMLIYAALSTLVGFFWLNQIAKLKN